MSMDEEVNNTNYANITITPRDILVEAVHPGIFEKNDDIEAFIMKTNRYFGVSGIQKTIRSLPVIGLIHRDLKNKY